MFIKLCVVIMLLEATPSAYFQILIINNTNIAVTRISEVEVASTSS